MCAANFPKHLEGEARFVTDRRSSPSVNGTVRIGTPDRTERVKKSYESKIKAAYTIR
jgi:hypothetical protein